MMQTQLKLFLIHLALAGETGERKGQAVGERKRRVEDGERN